MGGVGIRARVVMGGVGIRIEEVLGWVQGRRQMARTRARLVPLSTLQTRHTPNHRSLLEQDGGIQGKGSEEDLKMRWELSDQVRLCRSSGVRSGRQLASMSKGQPLIHTIKGGSITGLLTSTPRSGFSPPTKLGCSSGTCC